MDIFSIAGFALNVAAYLQEHPVPFWEAAEEPTAAVAEAPERAPIPDLDVALAAAVPEEKSTPRHDRSKVTARSPLVSEKALQRDARSLATPIASGEAAASRPEPFYVRDRDSRQGALRSGVDSSGQYFFRKR